MDDYLVIKKSVAMMGTTVTITVVSRDVERSKDAIDQAFGEVERIERLVSVFSDDSEVSRLNRQGYLDDADEDLIHLVKEAEKISILTGGIFDITVAPLIEYVDRHLPMSRGLLDDNIKEILDLVDYKCIHVEGRRISFRKKNMKIVLNGIAKGYAVDIAAETLKRYGIDHALINAGGDIKAIGGKTEKEPWRIGVRDPFHKERNISMLNIFDGAVATSGTYERRIAQGILSHIVNPKSPLKFGNVVSSTVVCGRTYTADALATSLCLMDPDQGVRMIESLEDVEAMLILSDGRLVRTRNFSRYEKESF